MEFQELYKRVSPRLEKIARFRGRNGAFVAKEDLLQEMRMYLWEKFKDGVPEGINDSYILRGCEYHISNYLRKKSEKRYLASLEEPINEEGNTLKDLLVQDGESLDRTVDKKMVIDHIKNNGFTKREKEVFSLILEGHNVREAGKELGISHVMVVKLKNRLIEKWHRKEKGLPG